MEIIYPDEFLKSLNENKDIDTLTDFDIADETYDYDYREDYIDPSDNYDDYDFNESYNYLSDYDYSDYSYLSNYDYRNSQSPKQNNEEEKKNQLAKIKIPYININRFRPPFPPFTPWQGPWWPWNYPWSIHFPWNFPWSMHKKNCCGGHDPHCHCTPKHPREDDKTHTNQRGYDYYYDEYDNYEYDDYNDYDFLEDERSYAMPSYTDSKPPTAPPPSKLPLKNNKNVKIIDFDGTHKCPPPKPGPGYPGGNPCKYVPPSYIRNCVGNLVYIWEINGHGYWAYLNKFERGFLTGWKWIGRRWIRFNQHVKRVDAILCYKNN